MFAVEDGSTDRTWQIREGRVSKDISGMVNMMRTALLTAIMVMFCPVAVTAQALPVDPATGQPFPDLTANCPNQVAAGTTLNVTSAYDQSCLGVHGTLNITALAGQTLTFKFGTVLGYPGCAINVTATASGSVVDLIGKDIAPTDQFQYGTGWLILGCRIRWNGIPIAPYTRVTSELQAGQTTAQVVSAAGWKAGDKIIKPDTRERQETQNGYEPVETQVLTLTAVTPTSITFTPPLSRGMVASMTADGVIDRYPHLGNLTRSIRFRAENPSGTRPHMLINGASDTLIDSAEFSDCGRTGLEDGALKGRYCIHFHYISPGTPFALTHYSVHDTGSSRWGPTIHHSNGGSVTDGVVYKALGAGIMTEHGGEQDNRIERNLIIDVPGRSGRTDANPHGNYGTGIWLEGPMNHVNGNAVYNASAAYAIFGWNPDAGPLMPAPLGEFNDDEAWGSFTSFECWFCYAGSPLGINRFFTVNMVQGIFNYGSADLTFNDFKDRGDPRQPHNTGYLALNWSGDYVQARGTFNRPDVQNRFSGFRLIYGGANYFEPYATVNSTVIRDGFFCGNQYDIRFAHDGGSSERDMDHSALLVNNLHCSGAKSSPVWVAWEGNLPVFQTKPVIMQVQSFNGVSGDDFRFYNNQTAPANATTRAHVLDKVVGGIVPEPDDDNDGVPNSSDKCPGTPSGAVVDAAGCPVSQTGSPSTSTITVLSGPTTIQNGQQLWKMQSVEGPAGTWQTQLWGTDTFRFNVTVVPGSGALPVVLMLHGAGGPNGPKEPQEFIDTTIPGIYVNPVSIWYVNGGIDPLTGTSRGEDWWMGYADSNGVFQPVTADRVVRYVQWTLTQTAKWTPDPNRVYVQGGSMGGGGAQKIGLLNPNLFAAVVGVTGWIDLNAWVNGSYCKPGMAWRTTVGPLCTNMHDTIYLAANATGRKIPLFLTWGSDDPFISPVRYPELFSSLDARQHPYMTEWRATQHSYFQIAGDPHLQQLLNVAPTLMAPTGNNPSGTAAGSRTNIGTGPPPVDSDGDGIPDSSDKCPTQPAPGTVDGCPVTSASMAVVYDGITRDMVRSMRVSCAGAPPCDGTNDPEFKVTFSAPVTVTRMSLTAPDGGWNTEPPNWMLAVTATNTSSLLNVDGPINATGSVFYLYVAEGGTPRFPVGTVVNVSAITSAGTVNGSVTIGSQPPPPDTTSPTVTLSVPASPLKATITVDAACSDNLGCVSVKLRIDGVDVGLADTTVPYQFSVNTASLSNASHTFSAIAQDAAGNIGIAPDVVRTVDNTQPPPPDPCVATPLVVSVSSWPSTAAGSRQFRYNASQSLRSFVVDTNLTRAVFTDTRGCQATVNR